MEDLVLLARKTLEDFFKTGKPNIKPDKKFQDKRGVFVTIRSYPDNELRGCVGFPSAKYTLCEAVQRAVVEAAFHDSRFSPVSREELDNLVFEVSVLDTPQFLNGLSPEEKFRKIEKGKDGLILEHGWRKGLFLPQVWDDIHDKKEFLEALCWKAGLTPDYAFDKDTRLYKFQVKVFKESKPKGKIAEIDFKKKEINI